MLETQWIEIFAVSMGILFIVLLIADNIWCWLFGILSSLAFVVLMYLSKLYSESILYVFYIGIGFYGWWKWKGGETGTLRITVPSFFRIITLIVAGVSLSLGMAWYFKSYTDAARPVADAFSTAFSLVASFMEAHKWLTAWIFWIVINAFSIWLYFDRELRLSSFLMLIYFLLSIFGYIQWKKKLYQQSI